MTGMEYELKAGLSPTEADSIAGALAALAGPGSRQLLVTSYFDTPDRSLCRAGAFVRIRRAGRRGQMTVKLGRSALGGYRLAREVTRSWSRSRPELGAVPDPEVRAMVQAAAGGAALMPWFTTRIERTTWRVPEAMGEIEVAIDRGRIEAGRRRVAVCEIEFELIAGSPEALFQLAARLLGPTSAWLALPGKADRGAALSEGRSLAPALATGRPPAISGLDSEAAVSRLLGWLAAQVATALHLTLTDDDETGPHQLRVALRRLRAAIRLMRPCMRKPVADCLQTSARDIGRIVSRLRDTDVLVPLFLDLARTRLPADEAAGLAQALDRFHQSLRAEVRQELRSEQTTGFAVRLLSLAVLGGWQARHAAHKQADDVAAASLKRQWRRIEPLGDRLAILDAEARHDLRKRLKNFRYGIEYISDRPSDKAYASALRKLQADLGRLNDSDVLACWDPAGLPPEVRAQMSALRQDQPKGKGRQARDLALGRAARHWAELRALAKPWQACAHPPPDDPAEPNP